MHRGITSHHWLACLISSTVLIHSRHAKLCSVVVAKLLWSSLLPIWIPLSYDATAIAIVLVSYSSCLLSKHSTKTKYIFLQPIKLHVLNFFRIYTKPCQWVVSWNKSPLSTWSFTYKEVLISCSCVAINFHTCNSLGMLHWIVRWATCIVRVVGLSNLQSYHTLHHVRQWQEQLAIVTRYVSVHQVLGYALYNLMLSHTIDVWILSSICEVILVSQWS